MSIFCILGVYIIIVLVEGTVTTLGTVIRLQSVSKDNVASKMAPQKNHNAILEQVAQGQDHDAAQVNNESHEEDKENERVTKEEGTQTDSKNEDDEFGDTPDQHHLKWGIFVPFVISIKVLTTACLIVMCFVAGCSPSHDIS